MWINNPSSIKNFGSERPVQGLISIIHIKAMRKCRYKKLAYGKCDFQDNVASFFYVCNFSNIKHFISHFAIKITYLKLAEQSSHFVDIKTKIYF